MEADGRSIKSDPVPADTQLLHLPKLMFGISNPVVLFVKNAPGAELRNNDRVFFALHRVTAMPEWHIGRLEEPKNPSLLDLHNVLGRLAV
jgi:hypothetical protein